MILHLINGILTYVHTPENEHRYTKWWIWKCISFEIWLFWVSIINLRGGIYVHHVHHIYLFRSSIPLKICLQGDDESAQVKEVRPIQPDRHQLPPSVFLSTKMSEKHVNKLYMPFLGGMF